LAEAESILKKMEGISNVQLTKDYNEFIFSVTGNFANVTALNKAVNGLAEKMNRSPFPTLRRKNFSYTEGTFTRHFDYPVDAEAYGKLNSMVRYVMETARVVSIYRFAQPVRRQSNEKARVSPSKKAVMMMTTLGSIAKGETTPANTIELQ
ncbi:MAG: hypothetical protein AAFO94_19230, partial [Bacteroidota bacterium]